MNQRTILIIVIAVITILIGVITYPYLQFFSLRQQCFAMLDQEARTVTMTSQGSELKIKELVEEIKRIEGVNSVELITSEAALQDFAKRHAGDVFLQESLAQLKGNPLPSTITTLYGSQGDLRELEETLRSSAQNKNISIEKIYTNEGDIKEFRNMIKEFSFSPIEYLTAPVSQESGETPQKIQRGLLEQCSLNGY